MAIRGISTPQRTERGLRSSSSSRAMRLKAELLRPRLSVFKNSPALRQSVGDAVAFREVGRRIASPQPRCANGLSFEPQPQNAIHVKARRTSLSEALPPFPSKLCLAPLNFP